MARTLVVAFLLAHGLLHPLMYALPMKPDDPPPFDVHRSWMLRAAHVATSTAFSTSIWLAWVTGALFASSAVALAVGMGVWTVAAIAGAAVGLVLKVGWFHPWLTLGVLLDVAVLATVTAAWPPSLY